MSTRAHERAVDLAAAPQRVFEALITPSAIRQWWSASCAIVIPGKDGTWVATWGDDEDRPQYIAAARLAEFDPPRRLVMNDYRYRSADGPLPFEAEFAVTFTIEARDGGGSTLTVRQEGFPADACADEFYAACEHGWEQTLTALRAYVEG